MLVLYQRYITTKLELGIRNSMFRAVSEWPPLEFLYQEAKRAIPKCNQKRNRLFYLKMQLNLFTPTNVWL